MLQVPLWSRILVVLILVTGVFIALPNILPEKMRSHLPGWWTSNMVSLGLDLQGGSSILLEVQFDQVRKDKIESLMGDIRRGLRKQRIAYDRVQMGDQGASLHIKDHAQFDQAKSAIDGLNPSSGSGLLAVGGRQFDVSSPGNDLISLQIDDAYKKQNENEIVSQSIEVVRRRIDELGTREPSIERQGDDRILVQVPGLKDPGHLIGVLQATAKMTFQLVDENVDITQAQKGIVPVDDEMLPDNEERNGVKQPPIVVKKRVLVAGDRLIDAKADFDSRGGEPIVSFKFDSVGAREFGDVTKDNVGHRFAIVLDKKVISSPSIREPILGGSGMIQGTFTSQSANDLAVLLRAGALPAPLKPIEQRTVGPEMGQDAINAGRFSTLAGLALVILFMVLRYGLFGIFADIALTFNLVLLIAILGFLGATLTLPGIAGIVLTMGMAVDANVLIYERIREEQRNGRGMIASIDTGFRRAMATIIDANMTHLIASLILFQLGSGPVRGFAVTLGLGIVTSFFTAVMVTRLIVVTWLNVRRPKTLTI